MSPQLENKIQQIKKCSKSDNFLDFHYNFIVNRVRRPSKTAPQPVGCTGNVSSIIRSVTNIVCNRLQVIIPLVQSVRSGCTRE